MSLPHRTEALCVFVKLDVGYVEFVMLKTLGLERVYPHLVCKESRHLPLPSNPNLIWPEESFDEH